MINLSNFNVEAGMEKTCAVKIATSLSILLICFGCQGSLRSLQSRMDGLINDYVAHRNFMGTVLVADEGKVVFVKGYGLADVEKNIPNTPETRFMIGSITKQFTAMLVTQLVEKGKLKLENTISDFLPDVPREIGQRITVEMLLNHASGLILPEGIEKYYYASTKEEFLKEYLKQLSEEGLRFEPGRGYGYSNAGYHILGHIIEKVTGKTYEAVLHEQILNPLGMSNTGCNRKGRVLNNRAYSYCRLPDRYVGWNNEKSHDPGVIYFSAGVMYSTVGDLFKFSTALSSNVLLSPEYLEMYLKLRNVKSRPPIPYMPQRLVDEFFKTCGNGFVGEISAIQDPDSKEEQTLYWHDGTMYLFKSFHYHFAGKEQIIIILSNCSLICEGDEMALRIYQVLNNRPYEHIHIKHSLAQYIEEEVAMHAGIPAAVDEYLRLKSDTVTFIMPSAQRLVNDGRQIVELGDLESAVRILRAALSEFPDSWEAHDALGETYMMKGDTTLAIQNFRKSLQLNPQNTRARERLNKLEAR
jgi:CubicO group peptidase (beta-lactamase class C family)